MIFTIRSSCCYIGDRTGWERHPSARESRAQKHPCAQPSGHLARVGVQVRPVPQAAQQLGGRQQTAGPLGAGQAGPDLDQCPVQYSGKLLPAQFVQGLGGLEEGQLIFPLQGGRQGAGGLLQSVLLLTALQQRRGPAQDCLLYTSDAADD